MGWGHFLLGGAAYKFFVADGERARLEEAMRNEQALCKLENAVTPDERTRIDAEFAREIAVFSGIMFLVATSLVAGIGVYLESLIVGAIIGILLFVMLLPVLTPLIAVPVILVIGVADIILRKANGASS